MKVDEVHSSLRNNYPPPRVLKKHNATNLFQKHEEDPLIHPELKHNQNIERPPHQNMPQEISSHDQIKERLS